DSGSTGPLLSLLAVRSSGCGTGGPPGRWSLPARRSDSLLLSPPAVCWRPSSGVLLGWKRQGVLADRGIHCSFCLGCPGRETPGREDTASAMGQLCCFPFSRDEEKISDKNGGEPDDAELVRLSKRLVENAVLKAVQQYLEETQNKNKPGDGSSVKTEEADRNGTDSDNNKK
uniref:A-kinase anchoring protein 7 n=2 Tax=Equus TaxID=9789 RepID=A0A9L0S2U5_HORSE